MENRIDTISSGDYSILLSVFFIYSERNGKQRDNAAYIRNAGEMYKMQPTGNATYGESVSNHLLRG